MTTKTKPNLRAVFSDQPATVPEPPAPVAASERPAPRKKDSHPNKKPVLIHIPADMHKDLKRLALEEGEPLTQITERLLREYLVRKGYTQHATE
jgi:hypothetical protein